MSIGERLKAERERLGLNQTDFGALGGVQKQAQLKYERGDRSPDSAYLASVSEAGVDVLYVLTGQRAPLPRMTQSMTYGSANVVAMPTNEYRQATSMEILGMVLDALHKLGKTLPANAIFAVTDSVVALQQAGATVNKSTIETQLRLVK